MGAARFDKKAFIDAVNAVKRENGGFRDVADILGKTEGGVRIAYARWAGTPGMAKLEVRKYAKRGSKVPVPA